MSTLIQLILRARHDDAGATATEYAILVGFLAFALILGVTVFGTSLNGWFSSLATGVGTFANNL